jgi:glutamate racemase
VFDSGVGGLTVLRELRRMLPGEDFVYLGDTARLPYGTKSPATVSRYSLQCAAVLVARGIRCLVVACNTASAFALDALRACYPPLPVIGVIDAGAAAAVAASRNRHIAVIATEGTIAGGAYERAIRRLDARIRVVSQACSLFVALAEEGLINGPIAEAVARRYLKPIFGDPIFAEQGTAERPDVLVLGCTHFPVLAPAIRAVLPSSVRIVDSAETTAAAVRHVLGPPAGGGRGSVTWLATDGAERFARVGGIFLGEPLQVDAVEIIDL